MGLHLKISTEENGNEEFIFSFNSDDDYVLYTIDVDLYERVKELLKSSLEFMEKNVINEDCLRNFGESTTDI